MSERLDRIETALERIGQQLDSQVEFNASLRVSMETLRNTVESERERTTELRQTVEALLQVAQIHQQDIEALAHAFQQHRSDGHGVDSQ